MSLRERLKKIERSSPVIQRLKRIKIFGFQVEESDGPTRDEAIALLNAEIQALIDLREELRDIAELSKHPGWHRIRELVTSKMVKMARLEHVLISKGEAQKAQEISLRIDIWRDLMRAIGAFEREYDTVADVMLAAKTGELMEILSGEPIEKVGEGNARTRTES